MSQLRQLGQRSSLSRSLFVLFRPSTDGRGLSKLGKSICFTQSSSTIVNLILKCLHRETQNNVQPNVWVPCDSIKVPHKTEPYNKHSQTRMEKHQVTCVLDVHYLSLYSSAGRCPVEAVYPSWGMMEVTEYRTRWRLQPLSNEFVGIVSELALGKDLRET